MKEAPDRRGSARPAFCAETPRSVHGAARYSRVGARPATVFARVARSRRRSAARAACSHPSRSTRSGGRRARADARGLLSLGAKCFEPAPPLCPRAPAPSPRGDSRRPAPRANPQPSRRRSRGVRGRRALRLHARARRRCRDVRPHSPDSRRRSPSRTGGVLRLRQHLARPRQRVRRSPKRLRRAVQTRARRLLRRQASDREVVLRDQLALLLEGFAERLRASTCAGTSLGIGQATRRLRARRSTRRSLHRLPAANDAPSSSWSGSVASTRCGEAHELERLGEGLRRGSRRPRGLRTRRGLVRLRFLASREGRDARKKSADALKTLRRGGTPRRGPPAPGPASPERRLVQCSPRGARDLRGAGEQTGARARQLPMSATRRRGGRPARARVVASDAIMEPAPAEPPRRWWRAVGRERRRERAADRG